MRAQAEKMGLDPNVWFLNVELAASKLVGSEPVRYVAHVYKYFVAYKLAAEATGSEVEVLGRSGSDSRHSNI